MDADGTCSAPDHAGISIARTLIRDRRAAGLTQQEYNRNIIGTVNYKNSMINVLAGVAGVLVLISFADVSPGGIIQSGLRIEEYIVGCNG